MNDKEKNSGFERFLFITPFYMLFLKNIIAYKNVKWFRSEDNALYQAIGKTNFVTVSLTYASLFCVILLCFIVYKRKRRLFSSGFNLNLIIILFAIAVWTFLSFLTEGVQQTVYYSSNPLVYLTIIAVIVGTDESLWSQLLKIAPILAVANILLSFYSYLSYTSKYSGTPGGNTPITTYFISGFWFLAVCVMGCKNKSNKNVLFIYAMIITCLVLSIIIRSRSWMLQCIILLFVTSIIAENRTSFIKLIRASILISAVCFIAYYVINNYYTDFLTSFIQRFGSDTRSFQYEEIFSQTPIIQFIFGGGIKATYRSKLYGNYGYIDNQYIFTLFHYGVFICIPYVYFFISSALRLWICRLRISNKVGCFIILIWLMALGGLSVFNVIIIDVKSILLPVVAGRCIYLKDNLIENRNKVKYVEGR